MGMYRLAVEFAPDPWKHMPLKKTTSRLWCTTAMLLLALFGVFFLAPLAFASQDAAASLPPCCRSNGKHQCTRRAASSADSAQQSPPPTIARISEKCPHSPYSPITVHSNSFKPAVAALTFAEIVAHPSVRPQTEAKRRIAFDRSRQKRGPPAPFLSA
jgi:hypothetical protein